jgi:nucleoside-diphosphate-sugar epimerase
MLLILGLGYSGQRIAQQARAAGLQVMSVRRTAAPGIVAFTDPALPGLMQTATHILSSVPPDGTTGADPVLGAFGPALAAHAGWIGYLSSTGVYGDTGGAWVDEAAPVGQGRRSARAAADLGWLALGAAVFRLPGIYGPGRSTFDQLQAGTARRVDRPGHRFNRIHVDDIAGAVLAALQAGWRGPLNVVDDLPEEPRRITEFACGLAGTALPPLAPIDDAGLSPMARGFWTERRLVSGHRLRTALGYRLRHPDYKAGLTAIWRGQGR